ncbi:hypothetical protein BBP40_005064 [Aspergillus hancockii]|nr:hypothetical protein BBP40_005064 [Aspergillus hancockii]
MENAEALSEVVSYVKNGGILIGLHFTSFTGFTQMDIPTTSSILPLGSPGSTEVSSAFPEPYSTKALHIKGYQEHERIFISGSGAKTQSHLFHPKSVDQTQAVVVGARVGNGY